MSLKVTHDGTPTSEVQERCCMCRKQTRFWHKSDVALCQECAKTTRLADLPTKAAWFEKEAEVERQRIAGRAGISNTPTGTEAKVCALIAERQAFGINKYGTTVADNPLVLRTWLQHQLEELLDAAIYCQRAIDELDAKEAAK